MEEKIRILAFLSLIIVFSSHLPYLNWWGFSTRREIIKLLANKSLSINEVAKWFEISRPATSKHIKILAESDLITIESSGRERYCHLNLSTIEEVFNWVKNYEYFWLNKLDNLDECMKKSKNK